MPLSLVIVIVLMKKLKHLLMNLTSPHVKKVTHVLEKSTPNIIIWNINIFVMKELKCK